jgi:2-haloalkanoic acid dehalogenase type II
LGETIVNLTDTIRVLAELVASNHPSAARVAPLAAKEWFMELAQSVPREESQPFETQEQVGTRVLTRVLRARGISIDTAGASLLLRDAWNRWQDQARFCEGVTNEWLNEVRTLSAGVAAVTDGDSEDVRTLLEKMGLKSCFDSVTTSEDVRAYKPNPRIYREALERMGAPASRSLFVSDSSLDLLGAASIGMGCALLERNRRKKDSALPKGTFLLRTPNDLNPILVQFTEFGRFPQT